MVGLGASRIEVDRHRFEVEVPGGGDPTRICELLVGLGDVEVLGVDDAPGGPLAVHIRTRSRPVCGGCGGAVWSKGASAVGLVDLPAFGRPVRLIWRTRRWCTSIVDVTGGQLLDIVPGRDAEAPISWLLAQPSAWRQSINWGVLDLSGAYRRTFEVALPQAGQVADPFHMIRLANNSIDKTRRRTQNDTLGHRGRKDDPLYRARRLLISAHERLSERGDAKLRGLLASGEPATPTARSAWRGTPKRPSAASTTSTAPNSPSATPPDSSTTSPTPTARPNCAAWAAPWPTGTPPSSTGTTHASPTDPPKRSTI